MTDNFIAVAFGVLVVYLAGRALYTMGYAQGYDDHREGKRRRYKRED
ncbi:hypothetical protein ACQKOE_07195 [Novosphingobium sp. NPDC080210]